jgi:uncharacterized RDD family membrane protein YckC
MTDIKQPNQASDSVAPVYAGFWIRFLAAILDSIFLLPIILIVAYFFGHDQVNINSINVNASHITTALNSVSINNTEDHLAFFVAIIYSALLVSSGKQATWGKRIVGIYVANEDGSKLSTLKAAMRYLATLLSACTFGIGFILIAFNKEKAALHDFICKTRVFYGRK